MPGLYVAGEDSGGAHGANRLGGNGVANSTVYGGVAGDVMGAEASSSAKLREPDEGRIQSESHAHFTRLNKSQAIFMLCDMN